MILQEKKEYRRPNPTAIDHQGSVEHSSIISIGPGRLHCPKPGANCQKQIMKGTPWLSRFTIKEKDL
jgi:hypothetical protein